MICLICSCIVSPLLAPPFAQMHQTEDIMLHVCWSLVHLSEATIWHVAHDVSIHTSLIVCLALIPYSANSLGFTFTFLSPAQVVAFVPEVTCQHSALIPNQALVIIFILSSINFGPLARVVHPHSFPSALVRFHLPSSVSSFLHHHYHASSSGPG